MIWTLFFKIVGIAYAAYYTSIIIFDLSPLNKKNIGINKTTPFDGLVIDTSHLNGFPPSGIAPIKASTVVPLHTAMNVKLPFDDVRTKEIVFDESGTLENTRPIHQGINVEDIDSHLGALHNTQTIDALFAQAHTESEDVASSIFDKYK